MENQFEGPERQNVRPPNDARSYQDKDETNGKPSAKKPSGASNRGFASMDQEMQRQIAAKGGRIAHQTGRAHEFTPEEARAAGRKGGQASHSNRNRRPPTNTGGVEASPN